MSPNCKLPLIVIVSFFLHGCIESESTFNHVNSSQASTPNNSANLDNELSGIISAKGLNGDPVSHQTLPSIYAATSQLGKRLFFSKSLSGNRDTACVTCHHPQLGGGDNLSLPIGVDSVNQDLLGWTFRNGTRWYSYPRC